MKRDFRMVEKPTGNVFTQISFKNASIGTHSIHVVQYMKKFAHRMFEF